MPEDKTPEDVEIQDTSTNQTPEDTDSREGTPVEATDASQNAPEDNWQERYLEAQSWGTRAAQEASQYRQIIDLARAGDQEARDYLGWPADRTDTEDDEFLTEDERLQQRLDRLENERAQEKEQLAAYQEAQEFAEAEQEYYEVELNRIDPKHDFSEQYESMVVALAREIPNQDNLPNVEEAHKQLQAYFEDQFKQRVQSKRNKPQAPSGASPSKETDLDDDAQRREYLHQRVSGALDDQLG